MSQRSPHGEPSFGGLAASYSAVLHEAIGNLFVNMVGETHPRVAEVLRRKLQACATCDLSMNVVDPMFARELEQRCLVAGTSEKAAPSQDDLLLLAEMDAKLVDVQRRARKFAGIAVTDAVARSGRVKLGDTFDEIMERFCRANLSQAAVSELLQYATVWPSFTTHPTNPMSYAYTAACADLEVAIGSFVPEEELLAALRRIRDTSLEFDALPAGAGPGQLVRKKTPQLEVQELCLFLDVAYRSVSGPQRRLRDALDRFGYQDVSISGSVARICVWGAGDGDGNPNMTADSLRHQLSVLDSRIRKCYLTDLNAASAVHKLSRGNAHMHAAVAAVVDAIKRGRGDMSGAALAELLRDLRGAITRCDSQTSGQQPQHAAVTAGLVRDALEAVDDLQMKAGTFGFFFAKTDVRHNSVDIMTTAAVLLSEFAASGQQPHGGDGSSTSNFLSWDATRQSALLRALLVAGDAGDALLRAVATVDDDALRARLDAKAGGPQLSAEDAATAARVFLRLRVMARNPLAFEKLIIAETRTSANGLAALLLLKLAGNVVAAPGASISIVPLFESRQDLRDAPRTFHELATDDVFRAHLDEVGHFIAMIAKSDTTRLSGAGVLGCQEETVARLMSLSHASYGGKFKMHIFVGGGDDQMRGGGRIVETPHVLSIAARRMHAHSPSRFAMTIQGMQLQILYGSRTEAEYFMEAFASQQCLAAARIQGYLPYRASTPGVNTHAAMTQVHDFFDAAMDGYEKHIGSPASDATPEQRWRRATMVAYLNGFPSAIITTGNKSSRPMSRKKTQDPLQGRAISLDQLSKHDGAYVTATLGVGEALRRLSTDIFHGDPEAAGGPDVRPTTAMRHGYLANKTFRDFVRMQAVVLAQKDYSVAWARRGGRPSTDDELVALARRYRDPRVWTSAPPDPRGLLAFMECEDATEARLLFTAVTGRSVAPGVNVALDAPLRAGWPHLARAMALRSRHSALGQALESRAAVQVTQTPDDESALRLGYFGYVGVNPQYSTPNFSLTMTDPVKEAAAARVLDSPRVTQRLRLPPWADAYRQKPTSRL